MNVAEVKATLHRAIEAAGEAMSVVRSVRDSNGKTLALAQTSTHNSDHDAVKEGLRLFGEAVHEHELVLRRLEDSIDAAEKYLRTLG
jgi:hypothetical protein